MSNHTWVNPRHVFLALSKNNRALLEELDEILLHFPAMLVPILVNFSRLDSSRGTSSNTSIGSTTILLSSMFIVYICLSIANIAK